MSSAAVDTSTASFNLDAKNPTVTKATHYQDGSGNSDVELVFSEAVTFSSATFSLYYENGTHIKDVTGSASSAMSATLDTGTTDIFAEADTIKVSGSVTDSDGNQFNDGTAENVSMKTATVTISSAENNAAVKGDAYRGEKVAIVGTDPVRITGPSGYNLQRSPGSNSNVYVWDTDGLDFGYYDVENIAGGGDGDTDANISVNNLGLTANLDESSYTDEDDVTGNVTSNGYDRPVHIDLLDSDGDSVDEVYTKVGADGDVDFDFGTQDTGNYTIEVTDLPSGVTTESDSFAVTKAADNVASFGTATLTEQRGDTAMITINLQGGSDTATLTVGNYDNDNYQANITVEDGDEDGEVVVYFNTYKAGQSPKTATSDNVVAWADGDDDKVTDFEQSAVGLDLLDSTDSGYEMNVRTGEHSGANTIDNPDNVGTLFLDERSTDGMMTWTAAADTSMSDLDEVDEISDAVADGTLTEDGAVARDDKLVLQVSATGLSGVFDSSSSSDDTQQFEDAVSNNALDMTMEQTGSLANQDANEFLLSASLTANAVEVVADEDNDTYYVVVNTANAVFDRTPKDGTEFETNFSVTGNRILDESADETTAAKEKKSQNASSMWTIEDRSLEFSEDPYNVNPASDQAIMGTTNIAPGSEITVRVRSTGDTQPRFIYTNESVVVQADGTWSTSFDFSNQSVGDTYKVTVTGADTGETEEVEGEVVEAVETTTEQETTEEETTEETTTEETTTEEMTTEETTTEEMTTAEPTETEETQTQTPGFGIAVAVVALLAAALLAVRRD